MAAALRRRIAVVGPWVLGGLWVLAGTGPVAAADGPVPAPAAPLDDIVVSGEKLSVETLIDRKVYTVSTDLQSTFGSLSDILNVIPSVDVDADGIVSLRGDTNVMVLIDGKPSAQFAGSSAGDNLQSIPAKDIERIEVLTTPPAQFKADGAAGVINIVTRKKRPDGTSGSVQGSLGSGGRSVTGADASYRSGALTMSGTAGYREDIRERSIVSSLSAPDPVTGAAQVGDSSTHERIRRETPTLGFTVGLVLNDRQSVSGAMTWADRGGLRTYTELDDTATAGGGMTSASTRQSSGHDPETDIDEKLGFTQSLSRSGETLELSVHRSTSRQHEHYDYIDDSVVPPMPTQLDNLSFRENHTTSEVGADYTLPISKVRSLKAGYDFEEDDYDFANVANLVDPLTGQQVPEASLTNDFSFRQQIHSLYASYQAIQGQWTWLGGLRAELTRTHAVQVTDNLVNDGRYARLYPSLHVDDAISDSSTLSFGASRRVTRPDPDNLNPYVDHEYTPNLRAGNPDLKPQFTQSYEVGYGFEGHGRSYGLTGYYRLNRDAVTDITTYLGGGLSLATKTNLPKSDSAGLEFSAAGHLVPTVSYTLSGNLFYSQIDASALGIEGLQSTVGLNAKFKLDYRPTGLDAAQLTVTRTDKRLTPQGYVAAINLVNAGYKHEFSSEWTGVLTVSDLFDGQRYQRYAVTPTFTQTYQRSVRGRVLYVGFVHSFGRIKKDKAAGFDYDQPG